MKKLLLLIALITLTNVSYALSLSENLLV